MMKAMYAPMEELAGFNSLKSMIGREKGILQAGGCIDSQKSHLIACLAEGHPVRVIVAPDDLRAKEIYDNYQVFDRNAMIYPARDFLFFQADIQSRYLTSQRVRVMRELAEGSLKELTVILSMRSLMSHCMPAEQWMDAIRSYSRGDEMNLEEEKAELLRIGYECTDQVEMPGQYANRGGILDIYPLTEENPVRIEFWGDEVDSIRSFEVQSQRCTQEMESIRICPAAEFVTNEEVTKRGLARISREAEKTEKKFRERHMSEEAFRVRSIAADVEERLRDFGDTSVMDGLCDYFYPDAVSLLDYFPADTPFFIDEPLRGIENAKAAEEEFADSFAHRLEKGYVLPGQMKMLYSLSSIEKSLGEKSLIALTMTSGGRLPWPSAGKFDMQTAGTGVYNGSFELLLKDLQKYRKERYRVVVLSASRTRGKRLAEELMDNDIMAFYSENPDRILQRGEIMVTLGSAHRGYAYPLLRFAVLSETDIFGAERKSRPRRKRNYEGKAIASFNQLAVGDYVVHEKYGIGIYRGVEQQKDDGIQKDYIKIEYAKNASLYIPATQLDRLQKYADADAKKPKISSLDGPGWNRTRARVRQAVEEVAQELVDLYALRSQQKGFAYGPDTSWQTEFEELFPFEETQDQLNAIEDTKRDMESDRIMDRLICGDVGFGKTEIAIRAAFKAVQDNRQVAYLVPTTILAQQHYNTFTQRMKDYPVRVDLLCRFRTKAEQAETVKGLKDGRVDIVIGTHRLLSKDIAFKRLGLLVVDEEQRFGVTHKEKIKQLRKNVDVLTLTATPIPRTLHMSLAGIRDMSVLEEAPQDRLPIQTFVMEYNEETVREAISRELARGGQVYYVYNNVAAISDMAAKISKLIPEARVAYAHGQMSAVQVEDVMYDFINGDTDILVSTTIIETGLDIPNVNTMIIHDADRMGLSQLYQLRGRVGRSSRTSYAFLMYRRDRQLRETAEKRLSAIREYTELGSGFRIAMRDLEIRGAGNVLGKAQSGHMSEVGYDLYCKLLNTAVLKLKGENMAEEDFETKIDLTVEAFLPDRYIKNENQKLDIYKRISSIGSEEEYSDMLDELMDRFGEPPRAVRNLLQVAMIKSWAHDCFLTELSQKGDELELRFYEKAPLDPNKVVLYVEKYNGRMRFYGGRNFYLSYSIVRKFGKTENILDLSESLLRDMKQIFFEAAKEDGTAT